MTNKEILQASLLDILFDNRNKSYGAYALRRNYNQRLLAALTIALSIVFFILLLNSFRKKEPEQLIPVTINDSVIVRHISIKPEKPIEPEKPKEKIKPIEKTAEIKYQTLKIVPDKPDINNVPTADDIKDKIISDKNVDGKKDDGKVENNINTDKNSGNGGNNDQPNTGESFEPDERNPEFPGGQEALIRFLRNNLNTPEELQAGEKKIVQIRFVVDVDGSISGVGIVQSGGTIYDREVIRACKKMPRWKPAFQNGTKIAISYVLPVTFIGVEQ